MAFRSAHFDTVKVTLHVCSVELCVKLHVGLFVPYKFPMTIKKYEMNELSDW